MKDTEKASRLRELIRGMERKLGVLEDEESACCGITLAQCHALVEIGRAGSISLNELAKLLGLDASTMSRTVNNLVTKGMAERELDAKDRRYITIRLTREGSEACCEMETNWSKYYEEIIRLIPEEKQDQVLESLQILLKAISESDCCS